MEIDRLIDTQIDCTYIISTLVTWHRIPSIRIQCLLQLYQIDRWMDRQIEDRCIDRQKRDRQKQRQRERWTDLTDRQILLIIYFFACHLIPPIRIQCLLALFLDKWIDRYTVRQMDFCDQREILKDHFRDNLFQLLVTLSILFGSGVSCSSINCNAR